MMGRSVLEARGVLTLATGLGLALALSACADERDDPMASSAEEGGIPLDSGGSVGDDDDDDDDEGDKLDVGGGSGGMAPCAEGGDCDECVEYEHTPCDQGSTDLFNVLGLNCPGEATITGSTEGSPAAIGIRSSFGNTATWAPREGSAYAVIGSGIVNDLDNETPPGDSDVGPTQCNDDLGPEYDKGGMLPAPLRTTDVGGDCAADPTLLGTGDCSNTIHDQFVQGMSANDYTEIRIEATVPPTNNSLSYDFAFFSTEYPFYFQSGFNDMYIGWLESESWTGNISFDAQGNPISLNAGFLDFKDATGGTLTDPACMAGCSAPELAGTCMKQHAGTRWLSSTAPVTPGEEITLVLAVFDLADSILDSYVFLDNFGWGCEGTSTPQTVPVG